MTFGVVCKPGWRACLAALLAQRAATNSIHLATLCVGESCTDPGFPILDYDEESERCVCNAHPCWEDDGKRHSCSDKPDFPYLSFRYSDQKELMCECSIFPHYSSTHVSHDLCSGHMCDKPDFPVLDYDEDKKECLCRVHPCWNDGGRKHACDKPGFPILRYRKDQVDGEEVDVCECQMSMEHDNHQGGGGGGYHGPGASDDEMDFADDDEALDEEF